MTYQYFLYGLNVESEIEIEEAYAKKFDGEPDVKVVRGELPVEVQDMYKDKTEDDVFFASSVSCFLFRKTVASYSVIMAYEYATGT